MERILRQQVVCENEPDWLGLEAVICDQLESRISKEKIFVEILKFALHEIKLQKRDRERNGSLLDIIVVTKTALDYLAQDS